VPAVGFSIRVHQPRQRRFSAPRFADHEGVAGSRYRNGPRPPPQRRGADRRLTTKIGGPGCGDQGALMRSSWDGCAEQDLGRDGASRPASRADRWQRTPAPPSQSRSAADPPGAGRWNRGSAGRNSAAGAICRPAALPDVARRAVSPARDRAAMRRRCRMLGSLKSDRG